jgi:phospholipid transport system transporter-binding protein
MMTHPQWHQIAPDFIQLKGALDRDQVPDLWQCLGQWRPDGAQVIFSLQYVDRVDSAGMVMLIHLIEHAKKYNCHIMLRFVPEQLRTLFQLSNVNSLVVGHIQEESEVDCG